jgi:hypothetical protein
MTSRIAAASLLCLASVLGACATDGTTPAPTDPSFAVGTGHNATDHFTIDQPIEFQIDNPCNGELIDFVGRETGQINAVDTREHLDNGNSIHFEHLSHVVASGVGQQTGAQYAINDVFHEVFESPSPPAPQFTAGFHDALRVTSAPPGSGFQLHTQMHVVLSPSANEAKVTRDIESVSCGT